MNMEEFSEIGFNLLKLRRKLKLSQERFGKKFGGFSGRQIHSYETGKSKIHPRLLRELSKQGFSLHEIFTDEKPATEAPKSPASELDREKLRLTREVEKLKEDIDDLLGVADVSEVEVALRHLKQQFNYIKNSIRYQKEKKEG